MKGYQIDITLPLEENVKAVLASLVQQLGLPDAFRQDASAAIHGTRKTIKRIRALLKMIRDGTGFSFYLRENRFFRDISRQISQARDYYVLLETLQFVASKTRKHSAEATVELRETITSALNEEMKSLSAPGGAFETVPAALEEALSRMNET
ncbi:MAG: CHAD domain-containing protein, partial [Bacteroidales bacterium]